MTRRQAALSCAAALTGFAAEKDSSGRIHFCRVPQQGIQPQMATDQRGNLHLAYYGGDAHHGDLFYVRSNDLGRTFSSPVRINSQPGSAIAAGSIRGAQIALGKDDTVHVAWNGSMEALPKGPVNPDSGKPGSPMLYSRGTGNAVQSFLPQQNLMHHSFGLDGGGSIAADAVGNVYLAWHGIGVSEASGSGKVGEARRALWITKSENDGGSFAAERRAWSKETGACGCCGVKIFADRRGRLYALYRSATESVHRDIYLLSSTDRGKTFEGKLLHKWNINACPMSSMDFAENGNSVVCAWETGGQVYWTSVTGGRVTEPVPAPGDGTGRKHPRIAVNQNGEVLLAWTEGTGWQKGGSFAYQVFDMSGRATSANGERPGIPVWSFAAARARPDGGFLIVY
jgi:hypothetical protein